MTPDIREAVLAYNGLDAGALGPAEVLRLPQPAVDEARTARPVSTPPDLLAVRSDALAAAGVTARFDDTARALILTASGDLAFRIVRLPARDVSPLITEATVSASEPSAFVLGTATGPIACGAIDPRRLELSVLHAWPAPPLAAWRDRVDATDRAIIDGSAAPASRWAETQQAGRIARLMCARGSDAVAIEARRWTRGLAPGERALIERFAVVCARQLTTRLERLQAIIQPDDASLDATWSWACWERDDLEGVRVLLREAGAGEACAAALRDADAIGRAIRFSWPSAVDVHDERLQRVSEMDPGAWWGSTRRAVAWW